MNIVVIDGRVEVFMDAADLAGCMCQKFSFPAPGTCTHDTDAGPCSGNPYCHSCITDFGVELAGQRLTPTISGGTDPWTYYYDPFALGQLTVVLEGCGHPSTRIPIDGAAFPQTTVTADYINGMTPHVQWTSAPPTPSALVMVYGGFGGDLCHVQNVTEYTAQGWTGAQSTRVSPIVSRTELETEFGHATIWRGGNGFAAFPNP